MRIESAIIDNGYMDINPDTLVIHETANRGGTAANHIEFWRRSDLKAHWVTDWTNDVVYNTVPDSRACSQTLYANDHTVGVELCHATNKEDFERVWKNGTEFAAYYLKKKGWDLSHMISHHEASIRWGGDHTDPDRYFEEFGKSWAEFKSDVNELLEQGDSVSGFIYDITYYQQYADLKKAFKGDKATYTRHFLQYGEREGRQACAMFDPAFYRSKYADLKKAYGNEWANYYNHYLKCGMKEGRTGSCVFDPAFYKAKYADLAKKYGDNWKGYAEHFLVCGMKEGRQASEEFDPKAYKAKYADLSKAFGDNMAAYYRHYCFYGKKEGRRGV